MRALISALVVAGVVGFALPAVADDAVTAPNKPKAAGRAIDDGAVTAPNKPKAAGRAIDDGTVTAPNKPKTAGRAIDDGTVTALTNRDRWPRIDDGTVGRTSRSSTAVQLQPRSRIPPSSRRQRSTASRAVQLTPAAR
jgi:hypothetical protein